MEIVLGPGGIREEKLAAALKSWLPEGRRERDGLKQGFPALQDA